MRIAERMPRRDNLSVVMVQVLLHHSINYSITPSSTQVRRATSRLLAPVPGRGHAMF